MFDLSTQVVLPRYELKLASGETKSYDSLLVGYKLHTIEGETNPEKIQACVNAAFGIEIDALATFQLLEDFTSFSEQHLEEPLKKVLGRESSSTTTSDSRPENSTNSVPKNT